ncbi:hypothetical protein K523DRAFT_357499 [Schizophyllum commune Tattone D]|nr:hypothetical protein K523DRAFT_357499 [Schizophyllum commune Tattone D]
MNGAFPSPSSHARVGGLVLLDLHPSAAVIRSLDSGSDGDDDSAQLQRRHIAISPTIKIVIVAAFSSLVIILLGLYLWWHVLQPIYHRALIRRRHRRRLE